VDLQIIRETLDGVASGAVSADEAMARLEGVAFVDLGDAKPDIHREARTGQPEAIYGPGKRPEQVAAVVRQLSDAGVRPILVTRATDRQYRAVHEVAPDAVHHPEAELIVVAPVDRSVPGLVAVVSAGTSDLRVADEASLVAEAFGLTVDRITDVGVAGIHRLLAHRSRLREAACVIVVAGMEGALPSVVAGLIPAPVIAVPTSVGYGASLGGLAALLGMLSSCVPGVTVVNVDNGLGAAMSALRIVGA
jgi:pyridinium-3,5-biscarboxylic acid mononucleotide synthase